MNDQTYKSLRGVIVTTLLANFHMHTEPAYGGDAALTVNDYAHYDSYEEMRDHLIAIERRACADDNLQDYGAIRKRVEDELMRVSWPLKPPEFNQTWCVWGACGAHARACVCDRIMAPLHIVTLTL